MFHLRLLIAISAIPFAWVYTSMAIAQVTPAGDNTGTVVNQNGNDFGISGGSLSGDGNNLFHNFSDFNLNPSQSATFSTTANIQNVLSRISGGNPSFINGLLQINGSGANLYLLNPAGIVFGSNAQLNVGGDFTASTAWGLGFDDELWTNGTDYTNLIGSPTQFLFDGTGAIINAADLDVTQGQSLNLFASNVVNTGNLTAKEGNIQIIAVPGSNTLRLSQTGQILGLEINTPSDAVTAMNLPELLTGSPIDTGLSLDNGKVTENATAAEISPHSGSTFIAGTLDASGNMGGEINVFGQDIDLVGANINASGTNGGGEILVGGDYLGSGDRPRALTTLVDANSVLNANAINTGNGGRIIVWSDARTDFDGSLSAKGGENLGNGGFAEISSKNILDIPTGWSQRINVSAVNGLVGKLLFDPNDITIVDVGATSIITNPETAIDSGNILLDSDIIGFLFGSDLEITTAVGVGGDGDITIGNGVDITNFANTLTLTANNNITVDPTANISPASGGGRLVFSATNNIDYQANIAPFSPGAIDVNFQAGGTISTANISTDGGSAVLQAGGNIATGDISTVGGAVAFTSTTGGISTGAIDTSSSAVAGAGAVNLVGNSDIVVDSIDARGLFTFAAGGDVDITTDGSLRVTNVIGFGLNSIDTSGTFGAGDGDINITHGGGLTSTPFVVTDSSTNGTAGGITTGSETIASGSFPGNYIQGTSPGRISISTTVPIPPPPPPTTIPTDPDLDPDPNPDGSDVDGSCPPNCDYVDDSGDPDDGLAGEAGTTNLAQIKAKLEKIFEQTNVNPALVYAFFVQADSDSPNIDGSFLKENKLKTKTDKATAQWEFRGDRLIDFLNAEDRFFTLDEKLNGDDVLELVMVTAKGKVVRYRIADATRSKVMAEARKFVRSVTSVRSGTTYLRPAQYLYDVFLRPLEADIKKEDIKNISFIMDDGLRALPIAALHDGEEFVVEKYSIGLMPSFSLTNVSEYVEPRNNLLLAMGASEFSDQEDLPAASLEARLIADEIWQNGGGDALVNQRFTVEELIEARSRKPYGIVHLATHGDFRSSKAGESYIQFKNERVALNDLQKLQLGAPPIELLVLSACRTAFGDRQAELGFAGLALASGAKSVIGSIWYVDDAATMGLMTELYESLQSFPIKAQALQQAQQALLYGKVRQEGNQLITNNESILLPPEYASLGTTDLSHPYYWSGFTIVGNPW